MIRLGFSLVWLGLIWLNFLFGKNGWEITGGEKIVGEKTQRGKDLAGGKT